MKTRMEEWDVGVIITQGAWWHIQAAVAFDTREHVDCAARREYSPIDELFREVEATAMHTKPHLLDVVALLSDLPAHGLLRGQVGTVVELLDGACEVEFSDDEGKTYAELALEPDELLVLHHRPQRAA